MSMNHTPFLRMLSYDPLANDGGAGMSRQLQPLSTIQCSDLVQLCDNGVPFARGRWGMRMTSCAPFPIILEPDGRTAYVHDLGDLPVAEQIGPGYWRIDNAKGYMVQA